jgi:hypothetical protein
MEHVRLEMALVENALAPGRVQPIVAHRIQLICALVTIQSSAAHMVHAKIPRVSLAYVSQLRLVRETQIRLTSVPVATIFNAALPVLLTAVRILSCVVATMRVIQIHINTLTLLFVHLGNSQRMMHSQAENAVKAAGISIVSTGGCSNRNNPQCTSLEQITSNAINCIKVLKSSSGCPITITGGQFSSL